jgi:hypothetical protein
VDEETNRSLRRLHAGHFTHSVAWADCAPLAVAKALGMGMGMGIGQGDPSGARRGNANATLSTSCSSERVQCAKSGAELQSSFWLQWHLFWRQDPSSSADDARTAERAHGLAEEDQL